ncbi:hypothetical protein K8I31_22040, partial [bacterium]|nr:hypothetical protein [bacterium]
HGLTDIERFTDHLGFIVKGKMMLEGATADLIDRFQMVDFVHSNGVTPPREMGFYIQERKDDRWRVLIDKQRDPETWLRDKNARDVTATPVTLEELFIGLAKGE